MLKTPFCSSSHVAAFPLVCRLVSAECEAAEGRDAHLQLGLICVFGEEGPR